MNKIFDDVCMKKFREVSASGADPYSLKKIVVLMAYRCQELEATLRADIDKIKAHLGLEK